MKASRTMEVGHGIKAADGARDVRQPPCADMVWIPVAGVSHGLGPSLSGGASAHRVSVDGFWIDRYPVTNARFARFVEATGHVTFAEKAAGSRADIRARCPRCSMRARSSSCSPPVRSISGTSRTGGRSCVAPTGDTRKVRQLRLDGLEQHPVVHVTFGDAEAFAALGG